MLYVYNAINNFPRKECQHTINDLLAKASNPNRVYIGVCFQYDPDADTDCFTHWPDARFADQVILSPTQLAPLHL